MSQANLQNEPAASGKISRKKAVAPVPIDPAKKRYRSSASAKRKEARNYAEIGHQYARDIVAGRIPACLQVRQACQRHLKDLENSRTKVFLYRFDAPAASRPCRFIEKLPHVRGQWARPKHGQTNTIRLEPWQIFIVISIFGWLCKSSSFRRFLEAYVKVPRKNAKSTLAAAIGLYMLCMDGEYGAEVYSGATTERQAMEVFRTAWSMTKNTPELKKYFGIESAVKSLFIVDDGSRFQPLVGDPGDGMSPSCAIIDEYHEHPTSVLIDTMQTGMGARQQPLVLVITTAGSSVEGPCHTLEREVEKMLDGRMDKDRRFGIMYGIDKEDDWKSEYALRKANPNFGVSVSEAFLKEAQASAIQSTHRQNTFKTKHLDVWVNAATGWMNMAAWDKCADPSLNLDQFHGLECVEGVDLAAKVDLASRIKVFRRDELGQVHYYAFGRHYVPQDRAQDGEHEHYERWVSIDALVAVPGPEIQLGLIEKEIFDEIPRFNRKCIAFDPWSAQQMQQNLAAKLPTDTIITIPQTTQYLSEAMKEVEAAVIAGRFHHNGDPVLSWAASCVIAREDHNGNVFPRKEKNGISKIDPMSALFNAISRAMIAKPVRRSIYETRGVLAV
jgi:phage terminase large subunit-like protein